MKKTLVVLGVLLTMPMANTGTMAAVSDWAESHGGRLRLIAPGGAPTADGSIRAGIEIFMEPGWKTYWRQPGDAGIPPLFDHGASTNIASATVHYPAPHRYEDEAGISIGYKDTVIFPVTIKAASPDMPVVLNLSAEYGLCEKICVPANADLSLEISKDMPVDSGIAQRLDQFSSQVPSAAKDGFAVRTVSRADEALTVETTLTEPDSKYDLFVEGPENWYLPPPEMIAAKGATISWRIALQWVPKKAVISGTELRFTLINGRRAVEQTWRLE